MPASPSACSLEVAEFAPVTGGANLFELLAGMHHVAQQIFVLMVCVDVDYIEVGVGETVDALDGISRLARSLRYLDIRAPIYVGVHGPQSNRLKPCASCGIPPHPRNDEGNVRKSSRSLRPAEQAAHAAANATGEFNGDEVYPHVGERTDVIADRGLRFAAGPGRLPN